jgi:hypothetical protein
LAAPPLAIASGSVCAGEKTGLLDLEPERVCVGGVPAEVGVCAERGRRCWLWAAAVEQDAVDCAGGSAVALQPSGQLRLIPSRLTTII